MRRKRRQSMQTAWWQILARDAALVAIVAASDFAFGHAGAAFSTLVAVGAIMRRS